MNIKRGLNRNLYLYYEYDLNNKKLKMIIKTKNKILTEKFLFFLYKMGIRNVEGTIIKNDYFYDYLFELSEINMDIILKIYDFYKKKSDVTYGILENEGIEILNSYFKDLKDIVINKKIPVLILRFKKGNKKILNLKFYDIEFEFDNKNDYKGGIINAYIS